MPKDRRRRRPLPAPGSDRRFVLRRLALLALGVLPLVLLPDEQGPARFIALLGLLLAGYQLLLLLLRLPDLIDSFFPVRTPRDPRTGRSTARAYPYAEGIGSGLFLAGLILLTGNIRSLDNTFGGLQLFWRAAGTGVLTGLILAWVLGRLFKDLYAESRRRFSLIAGLLLGGFTLFAGAAGLLNRAGAGPEHCARYRLEGRSRGSRGACYLFVVTAPGRTERFDVSNYDYGAAEGADSIVVCTRPGGLGYPVVDRFEP